MINYFLQNVDLDKTSLRNRRQIFIAINPFVPNTHFFYPLKTVRFSDVFREYKKAALGTNGLISFYV